MVSSWKRSGYTVDSIDENTAIAGNSVINDFQQVAGPVPCMGSQQPLLGNSSLGIIWDYLGFSFFVVPQELVLHWCSVVISFYRNYISIYSKYMKKTTKVARQ